MNNQITKDNIMMTAAPVSSTSLCKSPLPGQTNCGSTYHSGSTAVTWHEFSTLILDLARKNHPVKVRNILPITSEEFPTTAQRTK
jgi:dTDP-4-dehydrorhamnose reductase